jgi:hypothetical protein
MYLFNYKLTKKFYSYTNRLILFVFLLVTLNACTETNSLVGTWASESGKVKWIITRKKDKLRVSVNNNNVNIGVYPVEASEKEFTFRANIGVAVGKFNCSITTNNNRDSMSCKRTVTSFLSKHTKSFKMLRRKKVTL